MHLLLMYTYSCKDYAMQQSDFGPDGRVLPGRDSDFALVVVEDAVDELFPSL
jgi:hypothetical protein